jgi:hypothetical protein
MRKVGLALALLLDLLLQLQEAGLLLLGWHLMLLLMKQLGPDGGRHSRQRWLKEEGKCFATFFVKENAIKIFATFFAEESAKRDGKVLPMPKKERMTKLSIFAFKSDQ